MLVNGRSYLTIPGKVRIVGAMCSVLACPAIPLTLPTHDHMLVMVNGRRAVERTADALQDLIRAESTSDDGNDGRGQCPIVCLLMNGLGHREHMFSRLADRLRTETSPRLTPAQQSAQLSAFESRLYLATTTSGAKLEKKYSTLWYAGDIVHLPKLHNLHLRHGGMGVTTVIQNQADAHALKVQRQQQAAQPTTHEQPHSRLQSIMSRPPSSPPHSMLRRRWCRFFVRWVWSRISLRTRRPIRSSTRSC
jgi:hypothetical protein